MKKSEANVIIKAIEMCPNYCYNGYSSAYEYRRITEGAFEHFKELVYSMVEKEDECIKKKEVE